MPQVTVDIQFLARIADALPEGEIRQQLAALVFRQPQLYFAFAVADGMFQGDVTLSRRVLTVEQVKELVANQPVVSALNGNHKDTVDAMHQRYGITEVEIPATPPKVTLERGDSIIVMSVRGLPRRDAGQAEYTKEQIDAATFEFSMWSVL